MLMRDGKLEVPIMALSFPGRYRTNVPSRSEANPSAVNGIMPIRKLGIAVTTPKVMRKTLT